VILVRAFWKPEFISCGKERLMQFREFLVGIPPYRYRSCIAVMILTAEVKVTFKSTEGFQYVLPPPLWVTSIGPIVVIFWNTAQKDARVDRR
jgi:hypothetical protein